tara:strand:+ start:3700 stop:4230 length:531 start_codon:yes stop_codon:yes gene_type:complete
MSIIILFASCEDQGGPSYGCTDIDACNFDSEAEIEDGSCEYPDPIGSITGFADYCDCTGSTVQILDCYGECGGEAVSDCEGNCDDIVYTYNDIKNKMSSIGCLGCHTGTSSGGLDLSTYAGLTSLNTNSGGILDLDCATYTTSILLQKINGGSMSSYADSELIEMLTTWISQGAPG